ncbi:general transcription factor IIH subunit 5 [Daktulosphaira vitifoliae]|uniref:general transcription factor IIH subunit 5 n=1 Tax=Daktulosphaira vitifoliae TaxID=58002 RepID=UPI0021AA2A74|nr:general transcription factor IIH subunit 5 [Daktulosphaira vitifoliae]
MVHVSKGTLITCDQSMKQFLLQLDQTNALGKKFILQELDDEHLFVSSDVLETLEDRVDELMDQLTFTQN